jgi:hypothetical protein
MAAAKLLAVLVAVALVGHARADYSGTDVGLKPQIFQAFDRTHYYQLAEDAVGTVVSWLVFA